MIERIPVVALASYEPPRIERVLSPEDLEREVHYAGTLSISPQNPG